MDLNKMWTDLEKVFINDTDKVIDEEKIKLTSHVSNCLNKGLLSIFLDLGFKEGEDTDIDLWFEESGLVDKYKPLVKRWANNLLVTGYMMKNGDKYNLLLTNVFITKPNFKTLDEEASAKLDGLEAYIDSFAKEVIPVLKGQEKVSDFFKKNENLRPFEVIKQLPHYIDTAHKFLEQVNAALTINRDRKWNIAELANYDARVAASILEANKEKIETYTYIAETKEDIEEAKELLSKYSCVKFTTWDGIQDKKADFDMLVSFNTMDACLDISERINTIKHLLTDDAVVIFAQMLPNQPLLELSKALEQEAFIHYKDIRKESASSLLEKEAWEEVLNNAGFIHVKAIEICNWRIEKTVIFVTI